MKKNESQKCRAKIIQGREMKETNVKKGEDEENVGGDECESCEEPNE